LMPNIVRYTISSTKLRVLQNGRNLAGTKIITEIRTAGK
jgi:hypothetical protein